DAPIAVFASDDRHAPQRPAVHGMTRASQSSIVPVLDRRVPALALARLPLPRPAKRGLLALQRATARARAGLLGTAPRAVVRAVALVAFIGTLVLPFGLGYAIAHRGNGPSTEAASGSTATTVAATRAPSTTVTTTTTPPSTTTTAPARDITTQARACAAV